MEMPPILQPIRVERPIVRRIVKATIEVPDELYRQVKATAALRGLTLEDWLTEVLEREVDAPGPDAAGGRDPLPAAEAFVRELQRLAADVSGRWQGPQDAVAAVREQRRDLGA
jgi:hypothetical protein